MTNNDLKSLSKYWLDGSQLDWTTHKSLAKSKHYGPALFYLHLSLEKLVKALIVTQTKNHAPFNHNLVYLLGKTHLVFSESELSDLATISEFNMAARYPPEIKAFYRTATKGFVEQWQKNQKNCEKN